ncbi:Abi family protein [Listeria fleischmannii]|uniref:Abi family protein n=1 Tax=Listeria fleischmannii TaxID=1069827 RepID=UPI0021AB1BE2|nr:Abi family protein [Listeria fleischmannii]
MEENYPRNHPYKTFEEQLKLLKERNLIIDDEELALESIKTFSYYTIVNGYKDLFILPNSKNHFITGTTFSMLYEMHWIDLSISSILFKYTLAVEKKIKTQLANLVAERFSIEEEQYLNIKNYSQSKHYRGKINQLKDYISNAKKQDISAKHYFEKEKNLPPWILAKAISFGQIIQWYSILQKNHKQDIIKSFLGDNCSLTIDESLDFFKKALNQVYRYRNLSAHGNRNFKLSLPNNVKYSWKHLKKLHIDCFFENDGSPANQNNFYSVILTILLLINDQYVCGNLIIEIKNFILKYNQSSFNFNDKNIFQLLDFPEDIEQRLEKFYAAKFPQA